MRLRRRLPLIVVHRLCGGSPSLCTRRLYVARMPRTEPLTTRGSPSFSDSYTRDDATNVLGGPSASLPHLHDERTEREKAERDVHFPVKVEEMGLYDHGVTPDAKDFIAEAEADYAESMRYANHPPDAKDFIAEAEADYAESMRYANHLPDALPETFRRYDPALGQEVEVTRLTAPVGETMVTSEQTRFAFRGKTGELALQATRRDRHLLDEQAQRNLQKERQLEELLRAPLEALPKARQVTRFLEQFYTERLALRPRTAESVMLLLSHASLQLRLEGRTSANAFDALLEDDGRGEALATNAAAPALRLSADWRRMDDVPLLTEMRRLYAHTKMCFVAPTPMTVEHLMITLSGVTAADKGALHLANRLFLDCDKYVVLPTRTTYTAFVDICQRNDAMMMAVARMQDAVRQLHIPLDAPMATAILKGLNEGGYAQEALLVLGRIQYVPMTLPLFNAALETLLLSEDALACFSLFESVAGPAELRPDAETYTLLLLACEQSGQWGRSKEILADMQRRRVKGNTQTLNLLLKGLLKERLSSYAVQLYGTMREKQVQVWPELDKAMQHHTKRLSPK